MTSLYEQEREREKEQRHQGHIQSIIDEEWMQGGSCPDCKGMLTKLPQWEGKHLLTWICKKCEGTKYRVCGKEEKHE